MKEPSHNNLVASEKDEEGGAFVRRRREPDEILNIGVCNHHNHNSVHSMSIRETIKLGK